MNPNLDISLPTLVAELVLKVEDPPRLPRREFLTKSFPPQVNLLLVIDNSSLEKVKRCHMAAAYYLLYGRTLEFPSHRVTQLPRRDVWWFGACWV
jgi:hypothetical protein